jgi:hypothetical protein
LLRRTWIGVSGRNGRKIDEDAKAGNDQVVLVLRQQSGVIPRHRLPGHGRHAIAEAENCPIRNGTALSRIKIT